MSGFGTMYIDDLLFVCFGTDYIQQTYSDLIIQSKLDLIRKHIHPIGYKIIHWNKDTPKYKQHEVFSNTYVYCENKITENNTIVEQSKHLECFDIDSTSKPFYLNIHGLTVVFHNEKLKKTLIINGIADNITIDFFSNAYIHYRKSSITENIPQSSTIDTDIIKRIVNSMNIKDILIYGNGDIYKKNIMITSDVNFIKYNKLDIVIKKFLDIDILSQRNMLINLLLYNKEDDIQYITYMLYNLLTIHSNENVDSQEQKQIYDSLPWKIKTYFKDTMNLTIKYTQEIMSKYDINRISFEQQIFLLKAPENVKEKAMTKLKEIKGRNDDNSTKAKQYLDGLLKIPFNVFKHEPVLKKIKSLNEEYIFITQIISKLKVFDIKEKTNYTNIEIIKNIERYKGLLFSYFIEETSKKIRNANIKQLNNVIFYIQNLCKTNLINGGSFVSSNTKWKTKVQKMDGLIEFMEQNIKQVDINNYDIIGHIYKIFDIFQTESNDVIPMFSNIPIKIKQIENKIHSTKQTMDSITDILDQSIHGHANAKNQILKIFGQWMTGEQNGYCFGFEGSPGIGKTSLAKKGLANCLLDENNVSRPFAFIALGGSTNGSTLEGYNYTYVNSTWGRIVDILMETKCMNPIIYIDELDKVSRTEQGKEIIGILTHLIDTTQNDIFQDKYFSGINIDLSKVLFIFSYNDPEKIDKILLDRIHRIKFDNLNIQEKLVIVDKYIIPEINHKMGFNDTIHISKELIEYIIEHYTMEPGVRKLKEVLFDLYGEINIQILKGESDLLYNSIPIELTIQDIEKLLKKYPKIEEKHIHTENKIGVINGLWANSLGKGGIIPIEAVFFPSSTFLDLKLTGLQGDVMKESMNVAKTLAWNLTSGEEKKTLIKVFETTKCQGIHVHCPEGAVSKDGPSAGAAITVTIYSLLNKIKIKKDVAITGEINLQGDITAIGGLEHKILGGIRAGVKTFIYPESNHRDYTEFVRKFEQSSILDGIQFIRVSTIQEVFLIVFDE
jgi:ATP-dependent Lon protease